MLVLWTSQPPPPKHHLHTILYEPTLDYCRSFIVHICTLVVSSTHTLWSSGKNNSTNIVQKIDHVMMSFGYFCAPQCHIGYISKMHRYASYYCVALYSKAGGNSC